MARRKLEISKIKMFAVRDKESKVITNMNRIINIAEEFCRNLYSSRDHRNHNTGTPSTLEDIRSVMTEVRKAYEAMKKGETAGENPVTSNLLKDEGTDCVGKGDYFVYEVPPDGEGTRISEDAAVIYYCYMLLMLLQRMLTSPQYIRKWSKKS